MQKTSKSIPNITNNTYLKSLFLIFETISNDLINIFQFEFFFWKITWGNPSPYLLPLFSPVPLLPGLRSCEVRSWGQHFKVREEEIFLFLCTRDGEIRREQKKRNFVDDDGA